MIAPSPVRERKKRETWRLVHSTALRLMTERGFDAVSIDDIVAAAGISRRTFFNYFADKESVVFDPDPDDAALWAALLDERPPDEPLWDSLRELLIGYTTAAAERMLLQRRVRLASPELSGCSREVADRFWDVVREWAATRAGLDALRLDLTVNAARTVLNTACPHWDATSGITGLHAHLAAGFDFVHPAERISS
ncbi:TetR family transcriptional regulator [Actinoplanes friuliensis]|uniref:TetR family transcriptional regulator n=1 Tax=Actinoplanes friuliensis TaxID=196914 RepID=UPI0003F8C167|nr:TetR family transcriptional regulator [Actinoplanes friuliensis]